MLFRSTDENGNTEVNPKTGKNFTKLHPITDTLIWSTIATDIGDITEDNWEEFFIRFDICQRDTPWMYEVDDETKERTPRFITPEEVQSHIGLRCNVSYKTWRQWLGKKKKLYEQELERMKRLSQERIEEALKKTELVEETLAEAMEGRGANG